MTFLLLAFEKAFVLRGEWFYIYPHLTFCTFQCVQDPDFAEVLTDLNSRELFWLSRGQLEIAVAAEGQDPRQISGFITGRKSCDSKYLLQSVHPLLHVTSSVKAPDNEAAENMFVGLLLVHVWTVFVIHLYKYFFSVWFLSSLIAGGKPCLQTFCLTWWPTKTVCMCVCVCACARGEWLEECCGQLNRLKQLKHAHSLSVQCIFGHFTLA